VQRTLATESAGMRAVVALITRLAATDVTVTLVGETGTGKDVLAAGIHEMSARSGGPFVVFDCGSVARNLAESELFGHERGAFTGAQGVHLGAFERANGGTVFLDEIGELPLELQPRLLRVLESRTVRRVGGGQDRRVDVRIIAATNRNLETEVAAGRFRQDLYYRLAGAVVSVPSLRERREDVPQLACALLADLGHQDISLSSAALEALSRHPWPGNVRELKNTLACAVAFLDGHVVEPRHLRLPEAQSAEFGLERLSLAGLPLQEIEREAIRQTLVQNAGNKSQSARALGIAISTLYDKLKRHGL
jgi:DNA-binding NtrC family response regulator